MMLDAYDPAAHDLSRLRFWLTAGAAIPAALVEEAASQFRGCRVVSAYGSSEVMMATVCRPDDPIERVASSDGRPVPGVDLRIVNDGEPVPPGKRSEFSQALARWAGQVTGVGEATKQPSERRGLFSFLR